MKVTPLDNTSTTMIVAAHADGLPEPEHWHVTSCGGMMPAEKTSAFGWPTHYASTNYVKVEDYDLLRAKAQELQEQNVCDSCLGSGKAVSGIPCMCGGTGRMSDAARYLREQLVKERQQSESALAAALEREKAGRKDSERLDALEKAGMSVSCQWKNTGFCGPRGHEWRVFVYGDYNTWRDNGLGETLRNAIDAALGGKP